MNISNCGCIEKWGGYAPFILRVVIGLIFAMHGYQKLAQFGLEGTTGFLASLGFPAASVFAILLIAAELGGGILLILGLFTHWVAKILAIVSVVALFTVHISKGFFMATGGYEFIILILVATFSLMITGPGAFALDAKIKKSDAPTPQA